MKFKYALSALALASAFVAGSAQAAPFVMDVSAFGSTGAGDADTKTSAVSAFSLAWRATSTYTDNLANPYGNVGSLGVGDFVVDSGSGSVGILGADNNAIGGANNNEGIDSAYSLSFSYSNLPGYVSFVGDPLAPLPSQIGAVYSSGTIKMFASLLDGDGNPSSTSEVLELAVTGSTGTVGNFTLFTQLVNIDAGFLFLLDGTDFNDLLAINVVGGITDFNNPPVQVASVGTDPMQWARTTNLTGDLRFSVPEPGVLALLGLGFAGLGFARRNKKQA